MTAGASLDDLTTTELVTGILLNVDTKFSEQALYRFLNSIADDQNNLNERLKIVGNGVRLRSEPLRRVINFLEMGKILEVAMPNPVDQYFRPRKSQMASLEKQLTERGVLPAHAELFKELAEKFLESGKSDVVRLNG